MRNLTIFITTVSVCFIFYYYYYKNNKIMKTWPHNNLLWSDVMVSRTIKVNPFAPGDFAEKRVLKLVEWFSGHCRAIKS